MEPEKLTALYCLLLLALLCQEGHSNTHMRGLNLQNDNEGCQCQKRKDMFDIVQSIVKVSELKRLTVITNTAGSCGDMTHLNSLLLIMDCSNYQSFDPLSYKRTILSTIIIDCDAAKSQDIIIHYVSARTSGGVERRLILPVYNFIITKRLDLDTLRGLDLTANHFVSVTPHDPASNTDKETGNKSCHMMKTPCRHLMYIISQAKGQGHWEQIGYYAEGYHGNTPVVRDHFHNFEGMRLKITHSLYTPFTMGRNGNYYGFCMDLLETIAAHLNFTYEIVYSVDKKFGIKKSDGKWNGMMGMMERKEVDMIVAGLTITSHREEVVDFTVPFFEETSTVLVRANVTTKDDLWTHLFAPLQLHVWLLIAGSLVVCGLIVQAVEKTAVYTKRQLSSNHQPGNGLNLPESIWLLFAAYVKQGAVSLPSAGSSQFSMAMFWLMTFLVGSLYAANLTASLATITRSTPIKNLQELADNAEYTILLNGGSVQRLLLEGSPSGIYAALWRKMNKTRNISFQSSTGKAMKLMFDSNDAIKYAVMGDRVSLETKLYRDYPSQCDWTFIPETFFTSGLGVALPQDSAYKELFNEVIMKIVANGLPERWQKKHFLTSTCRIPKSGTQSEAKAINLGQIKIMLVIIGGGMVLSAIVFFLEILGAISARVSSKKSVQNDE